MDEGEEFTYRGLTVRLSLDGARGYGRPCITIEGEDVTDDCIQDADMAHWREYATQLVDAYHERSAKRPAR
jgi:hypothetical protein